LRNNIPSDGSTESSWTIDFQQSNVYDESFEQPSIIQPTGPEITPAVIELTAPPVDAPTTDPF